MDTVVLLQIFIMIIQILLLVAILFFIVFTLISNISLFLGVPFVPTPARFAGTIGDLLALSSGDVVYDLGCGDGRVLLALAALYPDTTFVGVEGNIFLVAVARWRASCAQVSNVSFRRANILKTDYREATKVYVYLSDSVLAKIEGTIATAPRLTHVVSRAFLFPHTKPVSTTEVEGSKGHGEHRLRLYVFER